MKLAFWRKTRPAPTRPGGAKGMRPIYPGSIVVVYACGHELQQPSNVPAPFICPHPEHIGWKPESSEVT